MRIVGDASGPESRGGDAGGRSGALTPETTVSGLPPGSPPRRVVVLMALLLLAFNLALKVSYVRGVNTIPISDELTYLDDVDQISKLLHGDRTGFRLDHPLYATFLFAVSLVADERPDLQRDVRYVQAVLAACVPVLLLLIGARFLRPSLAFVPALLASVDYLLNAYCASILTETLFIFVFYAYLWHLSELLCRRRLPGWRGALATGALTGVLFLARGSLLVLLPAVLLVRGGGRRGLLRSARFVGTAILCAVIFVAVFTLVHGRFLEDPSIDLPPLAARVLFWGNNPEAPPDEWYDAELPDRPLAAAARFIREQPGAWLRLKVSQAVAFFAPDYSRSPFWTESYDAGQLGRIASFRVPLLQDEAVVMAFVPSFLILWLLVIADLLRGRRPVAMLAGGLVVLLYASTYVITIAHFRYRFPLNPLFYLLMTAVWWRVLRAAAVRVGRWFPDVVRHGRRLATDAGWKVAALLGLGWFGWWAVPALNRHAAATHCGGEEVLLTRNADLTGSLPGNNAVGISSPLGEPRLHPQAENRGDDPLRELVDGLRTGTGDVNWEDIYWEGDWGPFVRQVVFSFPEETCLSRVRLAYARPYGNYRIDHVRVLVSRDGSQWEDFGFYTESERNVADERGLVEIDTTGRRWRLFPCDRRARFVRLDLRINRGANFIRLGEVYIWGRRLTRPSLVGLLHGAP